MDADRAFPMSGLPLAPPPADSDGFPKPRIAAVPRTDEIPVCTFAAENEASSGWDSLSEGKPGRIVCDLKDELSPLIFLAAAAALLATLSIVVALLLILLLVMFCGPMLLLTLLVGWLLPSLRKSDDPAWFTRKPVLKMGPFGIAVGPPGLSGWVVTAVKRDIPPVLDSRLLLLLPGCSGKVFSSRATVHARKHASKSIGTIEIQSIHETKTVRCVNPQHMYTGVQMEAGRDCENSFIQQQSFVHSSEVQPLIHAFHAYMRGGSKSAN